MQKLDKLEINSLTLDELEAILTTHSIPSYRGQQIFRWLHRNGITHINQMTNIPEQLRILLLKEFKLISLKQQLQKKSVDGTVKYLFELEDGHTIETVLIPEDDRNTICVSSQVGCAMGCSFCATGTQGLARNLTAGEIAGQVEFIKHEYNHITNIVFMGMGEPFNNYNAVMKSIEIMNHPQGMGLGSRRFTISTCGIVPKIQQLAKESNQIGLAISLHAASDEKRSKIMPINNKYPLAELIKACYYYVRVAKRRITFEYALIADFNDSQADAIALVKLLSGLNCHVNVIPINPVVDASYHRPPQPMVENFTHYLNEHHIPASIRKERGVDIEAACGQLKQATEEDFDENT